jgi:hypothetical protein
MHVWVAALFWIPDGFCVHNDDDFDPHLQVEDIHVIEQEVNVNRLQVEEVPVNVETISINEVKVPFDVYVDNIVTKEVIKQVEIERPIFKEVEVPVERVVVKDVEVPIERIVENIITKEVPVEKIVVKEVPVEIERVVIKEVFLCDIFFASAALLCRGMPPRPLLSLVFV